MTRVRIAKAKRKFPQLVRSVEEGFGPVTIEGINGNAVLISEAEWEYVNSVLKLPSLPHQQRNN